MDILAVLTGSRVRADVLALAFGPHRRVWNAMDLGRAARHPHQVVRRELQRLVTAGLIRTRTEDGVRHYETDADVPISREVALLVQQTRGRVPRIRHVLVHLRSRTIAWLVDGTAAGPGASRKAGASLLVLTSAPRSLVKVQLANALGKDLELHCMSIREWVARLDKGDVFLRQARRARKVWVLGSWADLIERERAELESRRWMPSLLQNWREELSDEWDDDWDPFAPRPAA